MTTQLYAIQSSDDLFKEIRKIIKEELTGTKKDFEGSNDSPYIKIEEVCKILQVTKPTVYDWVNKEFIKKYKINSRTYFNRDEILDFLKSQK
jgi:excisionase family DNA binding protein